MVGLLLMVRVFWCFSGFLWVYSESDWFFT
uniref:Uncharacterized protein n=1 Tax=mine drainage metagenome TaxID=410659 RepID=E6QJX7_9ZZZZ